MTPTSITSALKMDKPNILLIVMDTSRADYVEEPETMPHLHEFAEDCTWFPNTFANAPWTLPSHSSIFTGQYPSTHGVTGGEKNFTADRDLMTELSAAGYETAGFSNNPWISPDFGFDSFDNFVPCWQLFDRGADLAKISQKEGTRRQLRAIANQMLNLNAPFTLANAFYMKFVEGRYDSGAALTNYRFKQWFDGRGTDQPFFAFVNLMEPHLEYNPPRSHRSKFLDDEQSARWQEVNQDPWAHLTGTESMDQRDFDLLSDLYRAELHYLDARLDRLFEYLSAQGELDSTMVIVAGDHGENLGDYGLMDHQYSLRDTLLRVPLLIRYPSEFERGERDDRLVELRDLFPTIRSVAGCDELTDSGFSTRPVDLTTSRRRDTVVSEYLSPQPSIDTLCDRYDVERSSLEEYDRALRSIRTADTKLIEGSDGSSTLFATSDDDGGKSSEHTADEEVLADELRDILGEFSAVAQNDDRELADSNKQRLEDLGYL